MAYKLGEDGRWKQVSVDKNKVSPSSSSSPSNKESGSSNSDLNSSGGNSGGNSGGSRISSPQLLEGSNSSKKTGADSSAQDKYNEVSYNICEGTLKPVVAIPQMSSRVCLNILGVGNMLSGKYYIKSTQLTLDKSGLTQTINVRKTEFGGYTRLTDDSRDGRPSPLIR